MGNAHQQTYGTAVPTVRRAPRGRFATVFAGVCLWPRRRDGGGHPQAFFVDVPFEAGQRRTARDGYVAVHGVVSVDTDVASCVGGAAVIRPHHSQRRRRHSALQSRFCGVCRVVQVAGHDPRRHWPRQAAPGRPGAHCHHAGGGAAVGVEAQRAIQPPRHVATHPSTDACAR